MNTLLSSSQEAMESALRLVSQFITDWGKQDGQIICHYITITSSSMHNNGIVLYPLLRIDLAIVGFNPQNLEAYWPSNGPESCYEGARSFRVTGSGQSNVIRISGGN